MARTHVLQQLSNEEFERVTFSDDGTTPRGIPQYYSVDNYSGAISISPRLSTDKIALVMTITVEDKDGGR